MATVSPPEGKAENIIKRFLENGDADPHFIANSGIKPTNNRAEQVIRQIVIDRAASQDARSQKGREYKMRVNPAGRLRHAQRFRVQLNFMRNALRSLSYSAIPPPLPAL